MIVFTDNEGRILDVDSTKDASLTRIELADEGNPFVGWSKHKITCYRIEVDEEGRVTMMTPYIDSRTINKYAKMSGDIEELDHGLQGSNETVDMVLTEVTPTLEEMIVKNTDTIDTLLTEILPLLFGEVEE